MKIRSSIKRICKDCIKVRRNSTNYIICNNLKHKQKQG